MKSRYRERKLIIKDVASNIVLLNLISLFLKTELINSNRARDAKGIAKKKRISSMGRPAMLIPRVYCLENDQTPIYVNNMSQTIKKDPTIRKALRNALKFNTLEPFLEIKAIRSGDPNTNRSIMR